MAGYMKFDGIDGESQDTNHKNWSDIHTFHQGHHKPNTGTGVKRKHSDVVCDDWTITKAVDKASPKLAEAVWNGKVFPKVEIEITRSYTDKGRQCYLKWELKNVAVVGYTISGHCQGADVPLEELTLNAEEMKCEYKEADHAGKEKGTIAYSWKVEEGTKG
jgi:type VI secretion system secreted protein Hcp